MLRSIVKLMMNLSMISNRRIMRLAKIQSVSVSDVKI